MIELSIVRALGVSADIDEARLREAVAAVLDEADWAHTDTVVAVDIRLVGEPESASLNARYRDQPRATNVLSFSADARMPGLHALGDLVICMPVVSAEAASQHKSRRAHLTHMVVHGCFHLLGFDHIGDDEARAMESAERRVMARLGHEDPYTDLGVA